MAQQIENNDGGPRYGLGVNVFNEAKVQSTSSPAEGVAAERGQGFIYSGEAYIKASATGALFTIENNDASKQLEITRIYIYNIDTTESDVLIEQRFDVQTSGGDDLSAKDVGNFNKNRKSNKESNVIVKTSGPSNALTIDDNGVGPYHKFKATIELNSRNMNETNILGKGNNIAFFWSTADGAAPTAGQRIFFAVNAIYKDETNGA